MMGRLRWILALEVAAFGTAGLVHAGVLLPGHEHAKAATAEGIIALVLLAGLVSTGVAPRASRTAALAVQAFALLGTMVGLFTIAVGVGPRTIADLAFHAGIVAALAAGMVFAARSRRVRHASRVDQAPTSSARRRGQP
jgi:hypothetical protein